MAPPWVGGVASGVAAKYGIPVGPTRAAFAALSAVGGLGVILYMTLWLKTPADQQRAVEDASQLKATRAFKAPMPEVGGRRDTQVTIGRLILSGSLFLAVSALGAFAGLVSGYTGPVLFWVLLAMLGLMVAWMQAPRLSGGRNLGAIGIAAAGILLLVLATVMVLRSSGQISSQGQGLLTAIAVLVVVFAAIAPLAIRVVKDLTAARSREAIEAQRADIAAHLHDSVLQTLTLVRAAADDPARVRALSLAQERALRSWLYTGQEEAATSVAEALKKQAAEVEATYGVPIDVVTVGDMWPGPRQLAALAAASEAMTNAVRHGAPPITVFQEARAGELEIFVKDAGAGFDPALIPEDRQGLRNSILGRMSRVGGKAAIRFLSTGGTEIQIHLPGGKEGTRAGLANGESDGDTSRQDRPVVFHYREQPTGDTSQ